MRSLLTAAAVLVAFYAMILLIMFLAQRRILFRPDRTAPDLDRAGVPELRLMSVTASDNISLLTWYMPPSRCDASTPPGDDASTPLGDDAVHVVLFLHGNAGHIGHRAWRLATFRALGWGVMLPEYRGFGGNPGRPSERGLLADARAALAALLAMGIAPSRVLLWGESLGSGLAVRLAVEQSVGAVLLEAPYTSITDIARARFRFVPVRWLLRDRFDSLRWIGRVRAPVLVMHGARDRIIPVAMARALYEAAPEPKQLWIAPDAGHMDLVEAGAMEIAAGFVARLDRNG